MSKEFSNKEISILLFLFCHFWDFVNMVLAPFLLSASHYSILVLLGTLTFVYNIVYIFAHRQKTMSRENDIWIFQRGMKTWTTILSTLSLLTVGLNRKSPSGFLLHVREILAELIGNLDCAPWVSDLQRRIMDFNTRNLRKRNFLLLSSWEKSLNGTSRKHSWSKIKQLTLKPVLNLMSKLTERETAALLMGD